jgi:hypothetical protein
MRIDIDLRQFDTVIELWAGGVLRHRLVVGGGRQAAEASIERSLLRNRGLVVGKRTPEAILLSLGALEPVPMAAKGQSVSTGKPGGATLDGVDTAGVLHHLHAPLRDVGRRLGIGRPVELQVLGLPGLAAPLQNHLDLAVVP